MQTPLALLKHQSVGTGTDDTNRLPWILDSGHLDHLCTIVLGLSLFDQVGVTQLVLGESIDIGDRFASGRLGDEFDLVPLDVLDDHDLEFGEEVQGELVDSVSEDGFLDQQDVAASLLDLLAQGQEVLTFFLQDLVHLSVVVYYDLVVHLREQFRRNISRKCYIVYMPRAGNLRPAWESSTGTESTRSWLFRSGWDHRHC